MSPDSPELAQACLAVVQIGTRAGFRRRVMETLRKLVPAGGTFFFVGTRDERAYADGSRWVDGAHVPLAASQGQSLSGAFGFEVRSVVETVARVYETSELYPIEDQGELPFFRATAADRFTRTLLVFLHEGGVLFGLAGLQRRDDDPPFSTEEKASLERLGSFVVAGLKSQLAYDELSREASALRALGRVRGALFVVDRATKQVSWAADRERGLDWAEDVAPHEAVIVQAAEQALEAREKQQAIPTPPQLPMGAVVAVAKLDGDPVFGGGRCAVLRVEAKEDPGAAFGLSKREREIARLLVAGYSGVNVAAISGLSENTVRTYVRRLYGKLAVSNRADLVRKLLSPDSSRDAPSSQLAPPPDSALVEGDETLD